MLRHRLPFESSVTLIHSTSLDALVLSCGVCLASPSGESSSESARGVRSSSLLFQRGGRVPFKLLTGMSFHKMNCPTFAFLTEQNGVLLIILEFEKKFVK